MSNNKFSSKINIDTDISKYIDNLQINKKRKVNQLNNAIIYARCSTPAQNNNQQQSLQTQISMCIDYCHEYDLNIIKVIKDICHGHNIDKLQISSIPDEYSDTSIVIADPSRMSRNIANTMNFIEKCNKKNIILHFVRDDLTTDSNQDIKKVINLTCDAYIETQTLSKRLRTAFETKKNNGSILGRIQFGMESYTEMNQSNQIMIRKIRPNHMEQQIIKLINMLYFGCHDMSFFYNVFQSITKNTKYILTDSNQEIFAQIYYGNFTKKTIMEFLNENFILNRNNKWTVTMVDNILNKSENFPVNKYTV